MRNYIIRRVLLMIPTLLLVTVVVFLTIRLIPGNVVELLVMEHAQTAGGKQIGVEAIRRMLGMDVPPQVQYMRWMSGVMEE